MGFMKTKDDDVVRYAQMLSAMGTEPRLKIMRLLLSAHPDGMIVMDIQAELGIPGSTLSHHLEKLKKVGLARVQREHTCLHYSANTDNLQELLGFLFQECCSKSKAVRAEKIFLMCK
jgi:ArsR family transcriptional regulator, arsenate/arsenite/antimonite-responsive transcriptional repressor